jgi:lantibiotic modifying enzyme
MKFIGPTKEMADKLPKQLETFVPICSIQSLILLSHLLMKHEEKGSTDSFHYFRTVLTEIAKMTRLFNAYGVMLERTTNHFNNWVNALNVMDGFNNDERINESEQQ